MRERLENVDLDCFPGDIHALGNLRVRQVFVKPEAECILATLGQHADVQLSSKSASKFSTFTLARTVRRLPRNRSDPESLHSGISI